jgi:hypothetical protein
VSNAGIMSDNIAIRNPGKKFQPGGPRE